MRTRTLLLYTTLPFLAGIGCALFGQSSAPDLVKNPAALDAVRDRTLPSIFIAGDSTAAKSDGHPVQGWGVPFAGYFDSAKVNVVNRARGGRSSRTFITEGLWAKLLAEVKPGDFVLIQFGQNDAGAINEEPPGSTRPLRARGSLPGTGPETKEIVNVLTHQPEVVHSFGWYIQKMVTDVQARGATPLVLTLTVRNIWQDGRVERGSGDFRKWDREIAATCGVPLVDVTQIIADQYQVLGEEKVKTFFANDDTHVNETGADFNAAAVVAGLKGVRGGKFTLFLSPAGAAVKPDSLGWLNLPEPADLSLPSLFLIGDSTVRNGAGDGSGGQWGWGDPLSAYFDPTKINVVNRAVGGLSSRTFLTQGHWRRTLTFLKPGDYVLIQFGHNDDGPLNDTTRARGTIKGVGEETETIDNLLTHESEIVHSYGWYLRKYIRDIKAKGATPILCTLIPRKTWEEGHIAVSDKSYAAWARQIASEENVSLIDLNRMIAERYDALGPKKVEEMFADPHTHTSRVGAELNAAIVASALKKLPGHPFNSFFSQKALNEEGVLPAP